LIVKSTGEELQTKGFEVSLKDIYSGELYEIKIK